MLNSFGNKRTTLVSLQSVKVDLLYKYTSQFYHSTNNFVGKLSEDISYFCILMKTYFMDVVR